MLAAETAAVAVALRTSTFGGVVVVDGASRKLPERESGLSFPARRRGVVGVLRGEALGLRCSVRTD